MSNECIQKGIYLLRKAMAASSRRYLFEIPLTSGVAKYLGFIPVKLLESAVDLAKPKYLSTSLKGSRYRLEETGIAGLG